MKKKYRLRFEEGVLQTIERLLDYLRQRVKRTIQSLVDNPSPEVAIELRNRPNRYRIRLGDYRIVYRVDDADAIVTIQKVGKKEGPEFYENIE